MLSTHRGYVPRGARVANVVQMYGAPSASLLAEEISGRATDEAGLVADESENAVEQGEGDSRWGLPRRRVADIPAGQR